MTSDFKRLVRERMASTGERYSIARMHLLAKVTPAVPPVAVPPPTTAPPQWEYWEFDGVDISYDMQVVMYDDIVAAVHSGDFPVGYVELEEMMFSDIDRDEGTAKFHVNFTAEHHGEDYPFDGFVTGSIRFDPDAESREEFLDSIEVSEAQEQFNME